MANPAITRFVRFAPRAEIEVSGAVWMALERDVRARTADMAALDHACGLGVSPATIEVTVRDTRSGQVIEQKQLWEFY